MYDIITCGSSTIDVFGDTSSELIKIKTRKYEEDHIAYPSGVKILIKKLDFRLGGGGINSAVVSKSLGLNVAYLGAIGNDENSKLVLKNLNKLKIDFIGTKVEKQTGYAIILDSIEKDRTILKYSGSNDYLTFKDIDKSKLKTKWIYFTSMIGESFKTIEKIAQLAKKNKIKVAFNPSNYITKKGLRHISKIMKLCTLFMVNQVEAFQLVHVEGINEQLKALKKLGPKMVIVTEGKEGAGFTDGKQYLYVKPNCVETVEVTGAGDTFGASFVTGQILKPGNHKFALKLAQLNAESVIQQPGAHKGILNWKKAKESLKKSVKIINL